MFVVGGGPVLAEREGERGGARGLGGRRRGGGLGITHAAHLPEGRDVIDVDAEAGE